MQETRCKICGHRWNIHHLTQWNDDVLLCDGESGFCGCTRFYKDSQTKTIN